MKTITNTKINLSILITLTHLRNELVVGTSHSHRPEQGLEIIRKFTSTSVFLSRRVKGDEDARVKINLDFSTEKSDPSQADQAKESRRVGSHSLLETVSTFYGQGVWEVEIPLLINSIVALTARRLKAILTRATIEFGV